MTNTRTQFNKLFKLLREDKELWEAWKANIAVQFQDEYARQDDGLMDSHTSNAIHGISNVAAENFLKLLTREPPKKKRVRKKKNES